MTWILPPSSSLKEAYSEVCEDVSRWMWKDSLFSTLAPYTLDTKTWHYSLADCETGCCAATQSTHVSAITFYSAPQIGNKWQSIHSCRQCKGFPGSLSPLSPQFSSVARRAPGRRSPRHCGEIRREPGLQDRTVVN